MNQFGSRPAWASVSGSFWTLEVSYVLPWSRRGASICLLVAAIFTRLWGGGGCIGKLVKPSSGLRLECERGGPAHSDFFFFFAETFWFCSSGRGRMEQLFVTIWKGFTLLGSQRLWRVFFCFMLLFFGCSDVLSSSGVRRWGCNKRWLTSPVPSLSNRSPAER